MPRGLVIPANFKKHGGPRDSVIRAINLPQIVVALSALNQKTQHVATADGAPTPFGQLLCDYFAHRATALNGQVQANLMDGASARTLYRACKARYPSQRASVMNKQKGASAPRHT